MQYPLNMKFNNNFIADKSQAFISNPLSVPYQLFLLLLLPSPPLLLLLLQLHFILLLKINLSSYMCFFLLLLCTFYESISFSGDICCESCIRILCGCIPSAGGAMPRTQLLWMLTSFKHQPPSRDPVNALTA